ncbi:hypothetical protein L1987_32118 [Smallanthus sonchifolius]|uniref:Uncharacterized protein n=1 Tax=Smallanthus sonchifolius TaxID=185202 RepID=A0ACB9IA73_9ASTR|nr:hypothetical protein L1987_32118 [Smallanthus sonchifolius]
MGSGSGKSGIRAINRRNRGFVEGTSRDDKGECSTHPNGRRTDFIRESSGQKRGHRFKRDRDVVTQKMVRVGLSNLRLDSGNRESERLHLKQNWKIRAANKVIISARSKKKHGWPKDEQGTSAMFFMPPNWNRTFVFRRYRDALKSVRVPSGRSHVVSSSSGGGPAIEMTVLKKNRSYVPLNTDDPGTSNVGAPTVGLPPAWVDVSEELAANIQRARSKMADLAKAHAKALMPSFGDGKEDQHRIEALTYEVTDLLKKSEKRLRKLSAGGPFEDSTIRKNVQRSLASDLQSLSVELRRKQSNYLKCLKQQKEGSDGVDLEMNLNGKHSIREDDGFDGMSFNKHQMAKLKKSEALTVEREKEIQQVAESVNELAQIMKDLSVLVIDQGTIIDRIDYNIQNVAVTVDEGLKQLQKAERNQKQGEMVMCATVLVIMCFVMLVLLILKEIVF